MARVADNVLKFTEKGYWSDDDDDENRVYSGPWNPYVRDIDPTILIKDTGNFEEDSQSKFWWIDGQYITEEVSDDDWISNEENFPSGGEVISMKDEEGKEWLMLEGSPEWAEKRRVGEEKYNSSHKRMWWQLRSYLVKEEDYEEFVSWSSKQDFYGRWAPESSDRYEVFSREYFSSPAYNFFQKEYYNGELWRTISNRKSKEQFKVMVTTESYHWEEEYDFSKNKTIRMFKPSKDIFEGMCLKWSKREGEYIDEKGRIVCFDSSIHNNSKQFLLVQKIQNDL